MADYAHPDFIVETDWLAAHKDDAGVVLIDCDVPDMYRRAHIAGARVHTGDHFYKNSADRLLIMGPEQFAQTMSSLGIGDDTLVIGYDASGGLYGARLWWCLNYYGHTNVKTLNGGWNAWLSEGRPVTMAEPPKPAETTFTPRVRDDWRATAEYIMKDAIDNPDVVLLDVRSDAEWDGTNNRGNKRAGRMPGSVHLEWLNNVASDGARRFKDADKLRAQFEAVGVTPDKEVVTYCQGGIRAAQAAMTLRLLGYERVRNYDGSFFEWANRDDTPVV